MFLSKPPIKLRGHFYLSSLWSALRESFNLRQIPNVCITMGFPSRRARSRASNRAPGEILVQEWKGTEVEKALVSIHPERFSDVHQVARAVLFVIGNEVYGSRRNLGSLTLGIQLDKATGHLLFTHDEKGMNAEAVLNNVVKNLGPIPEGFAEMPEPKGVQRTKANKYSCPVCKTNIRCAIPLQALCLHGGKPEFGQPAARFELQVRTSPETTAPPEAIRVAETVRPTPAAVSHGRMFGAAI